MRKICREIGKGKLQFGKIKYRKDENMKVYPNINKARAKLKWQPKTPRYERGYGKMFIENVLQAEEGCDFGFLKGHSDVERSATQHG